MSFYKKKNKIRAGHLFAVLAVLVLSALMFLSPVKASGAQDITILVEVTCSGSDIPDEAFRIELVDSQGKTDAREVLLTNSKRTGETEFSLSLGEGEYTYLLKEAVGETTGMRYSDKSYTVKVKVDASGNAYITAVDNSTGVESKPDSLSFENVYTVPSSVKGDPPVGIQKRIAGDVPSSKDAFVFVMEPETSGDPLPDGANDGKKEVTVYGEGEEEFGFITFTEPGVYRYRVYEKNGSTGGYTYDDTVYTVIYTVTEGSGGTLFCERVILKNADNVNACVFTNNYKAGKDGSKKGGTPGTGDFSDNNAYKALIIAFSAAAVFISAVLIRRKKQ